MGTVYSVFDDKVLECIKKQEEIKILHDGDCCLNTYLKMVEPDAYKVYKEYLESNKLKNQYKIESETN